MPTKVATSPSEVTPISVPPARGQPDRTVALEVDPVGDRDHLVADVGKQATQLITDAQRHTDEPADAGGAIGKCLGRAAEPAGNRGVEAIRRAVTIGAREPGAGERSVAEVHGAHVGAVGDERAGRVQDAAPVAMRDEASRNEEPREAQRERVLGPKTLMNRSRGSCATR